MLTQLHIENIAVIEKLDLTLENGLLVLTGETGAGKSIIIDSINMVLGERANKELIRTSKNSAYVSAVFEQLNSGVIRKIEALGFSLEDGQLIVSREITLDGKSVAKINARPVTVSVLKEIGKALVNIHGQHDSQALLLPENHIDFVDSFGKCDNELIQYKQTYEKISAVRDEIKALQLDTQEKQRRMQLLKYQFEEIDQANLKADEEQQLLERKAFIQNSEKYIKAVGGAYNYLSGEDENSAKAKIDLAITDLSHIAGLSEQIDALNSQLSNLSYTLADCIDILLKYIDNDIYDENELDGIESRLDIIYRLKKKYGHDVNEVLRYCEQCRQEYNSIEQSDQTIIQLKEQYDVLLEQLKANAMLLTKKREKSAKELESKIVNELAYLDMPKVKFVVSITPCKFYSKGGDELEFLISANQGEQPKPLSKIASGGELSRIMLGIKSIFTKQDVVDTLVFDEIDTGVSGSAAQKIGYKMKAIAKNKQVICITHLSQIAALSDCHYLIEKTVEKDNTFTRVKQLDYNGRVLELARIISGVNITDAALETAKELLKNEMER